MRAVQEVHAGEASLDHAVDVLLELEARYRIGVHTDFGGLAGGGEHLAWRLRPGQPPLPLGELVGPAWRVTATREIVEQRYELRDDDLTEVEYRERLFPFLSDTRISEALAMLRVADVRRQDLVQCFDHERERADAAASAIELLRRGGASAEVNVPEPTGMTAPAMARMNAAARLARAVQDKSKFERTVMDCLHSLWSVRPDLVDRVRAEL